MVTSIQAQGRAGRFTANTTGPLPQSRAIVEPTQESMSTHLSRTLRRVCRRSASAGRFSQAIRSPLVAVADQPQTAAHLHLGDALVGRAGGGAVRRPSGRPVRG